MIRECRAHYRAPCRNTHNHRRSAGRRPRRLPLSRIWSLAGSIASVSPFTGRADDAVGRPQQAVPESVAVRLVRSFESDHVIAPAGMVPGRSTTATGAPDAVMLARGSGGAAEELSRTGASRPTGRRGRHHRGGAARHSRAASRAARRRGGRCSACRRSGSCHPAGSCGRPDPMRPDRELIMLGVEHDALARHHAAGIDELVAIRVDDPDVAVARSRVLEAVAAFTDEVGRRRHRFRPLQFGFDGVFVLHPPRRPARLSRVQRRPCIPGAAVPS